MVGSVSHLTCSRRVGATQKSNMASIPTCVVRSGACKVPMEAGTRAASLRAFTLKSPTNRAWPNTDSMALSCFRRMAPRSHHESCRCRFTTLGACPRNGDAHSAFSDHGIRTDRPRKGYHVVQLHGVPTCGVQPGGKKPVLTHDVPLFFRESSRPTVGASLETKLLAAQCTPTRQCAHPSRKTNLLSGSN